MEEEIIVKSQKGRLTKMLAMATVVSSLGSFQQGYTEWMIHNPVTIMIKNTNETLEGKGLMNIEQTLKLLMTLTVIMFPIGGIIGSLLFGPMADKCGRKSTLLKTNSLAVVAAILQGFSKALDLYNFDIFARCLAGMCAGIFSCVVPLYIGEIAPIKRRGAFIMTSVLFLTTGFFIAQILCLPDVFGNKDGLPFLVSFSGLVGLFSTPLLMLSPESPRFLFIQKNDIENAKEVLQNLRGVDNVEDELADLQKEDISEKAEKNMNAFKLLRFQPLRWQLFSVIIVMGGNELAGVRGAYFYSEKIYQSLNAKRIRVEFISICVTSLHVLVISIVMSIIDTVGRRFLLLIGFMVCSVACVLLTWILEMQLRNPWIGIVSVLLLIVYFIGFLVAPGSVPNVIEVELFLQSSRASAFVIGGIISWAAKFLTAIVFLGLEPLIGSFSLFIFWPLCVATFIYIFMIIPETKRKTFLEIQELMTTNAA